jgi:hypothetical protein
VINDIMAITVRTFHAVAPGRMNVEAWSLAPRGEAPEHRQHRLENFLTFLGPGGFATPDDIEGLESCQRGYATTPGEWNDSRAMCGPEPPPWRTPASRLLAALAGAAPGVASLAEARRVATLARQSAAADLTRAEIKDFLFRRLRCSTSGSSTNGSLFSDDCAGVPSTDAPDASPAIRCS